MTSSLADAIDKALEVALTSDPEGGINTVGTAMLVRRSIADHVATTGLVEQDANLIAGVEAALEVALTPDPEGGVNTVGTAMLVRRSIADHVATTGHVEPLR